MTNNLFHQSIFYSEIQKLLTVTMYHGELSGENNKIIQGMIQKRKWNNKKQGKSVSKSAINLFLFF